LVLIFFSLVEALFFGLNFLPIQSVTVVVLYIMARSAAKKEEKRLAMEEANENRLKQVAAYRLQSQMVAQAQMAANDAQYQKVA
jgi:Mg2+/citrate symporter